MTVYRDIDELNETYVSLGVDYAFDITDQLNIGAGASVGYAGDEFCADESAGWFDYNLSISMGYTITEALGVSAFIKYTDSLDKDNLADAENGGLLDVNTYGGIGISYSF